MKMNKSHPLIVPYRDVVNNKITSWTYQATRDHLGFDPVKLAAFYRSLRDNVLSANNHVFCIDLVSRIEPTTSNFADFYLSGGHLAVLELIGDVGRRNHKGLLLDGPKRNVEAVSISVPRDSRELGRAVEDLAKRYGAEFVRPRQA
jgi:hypothetical protein